MIPCRAARRPTTSSPISFVACAACDAAPRIRPFAASSCSGRHADSAIGDVDAVTAGVGVGSGDADPRLGRGEMRAVLDELGHQVCQVRDDRAAHRRRFDLVGADPPVVLDPGQRGTQYVGHPRRPRPAPVGKRAGQHQHALGVPAGPGGRVLESRQLREHARAALRGLQLADLGDEPIHQAVVPPREMGREVAGPPVPVVLLRGERHRGGVEGRDRPRQRDHLDGAPARRSRDTRRRPPPRPTSSAAATAGSVSFAARSTSSAQRPDRPQDARGDQDRHGGDDQQHQQRPARAATPVPGRPSSATTTSRTAAAAAATATPTPSSSAMRRAALDCLPPCGPDRRGNPHRGPTSPSAQQLRQLPGHRRRRALGRGRRGLGAGGALGRGMRRRPGPATSRAIGPSPAW